MRKSWFGYELENFPYEKIGSIRKKKHLLGTHAWSSLWQTISIKLKVDSEIKKKK